MNKNKLTMISEEFEVETSNGKVDRVTGITVLVNGQFKDVLESLMQVNNIESHKELLKEVIFRGVSSMIDDYKD